MNTQTLVKSQDSRATILNRKKSLDIFERFERAKVQDDQKVTFAKWNNSPHALSVGLKQMLRNKQTNQDGIFSNNRKRIRIAQQIKGGYC